LKPQAVKVLHKILSRPCGCNSEGRPQCLEAFHTLELHNSTVEQMVAWQSLHELDQDRMLFQHIRDLAIAQGLIATNCRT
jgi:hypothetical protein